MDVFFLFVRGLIGDARPWVSGHPGAAVICCINASSAVASWSDVTEGATVAKCRLPGLLTSFTACMHPTHVPCVGITTSEDLRWGFLRWANVCCN